MKKRVIFFTTALTYGGTEKVMLYYANYLVNHGYDVRVIAMFDVNIVDTLQEHIDKAIDIRFLSNKKKGNLFYRLVLGYNKSRLNQLLYVCFRSLFNFYFFFRFKKIVEIPKTDVLITFDSGLPNYIPQIKFGMHVIWCHFSVDHMFGNFFKNYRVKKWVSDLSKYQKVIAVSKGIKEQLIQANFVKAEQIYNPTDPLIVEKAQSYFALPFNHFYQPYIVTVSRLEEGQKDNTTLIKTIALLKKMHQFKMPLVIVGDGRDKQKLLNLVKELRLEDQVFLIGNQKNPYPFILNSKLFVLSSKFEGLGVVLLEALTLGKLIIASDCPTGPREILAKDELLVKVGDVKEMADKIFNLLTNEVLQTDVKDHLRRQKSIFLPQNSYQKFEDLLQS